MSHWYDPLRDIESLGRSARRPGSLAGLAAARTAHRGQFFTPDDLSAVLWRIAVPAMDAYLAAGGPDARRVRLLDNSVGSGRLLQFAEPSRHVLYGLDTDAETVGELGRIAEAAGFVTHFKTGGMESADVSGMHVALINPPFSLHLESPHLEPYPCTAYGRFGDHTSAVSHAYAVAQAVAAAEIVVALLPSGFARELWLTPERFMDEPDTTRRVALIDLPGGLFREENTEVSVSIVVFGPHGSPAPREYRLHSLFDPLPDLGLVLHRDDPYPRLRVHGIEDEGPSITLPVTGVRTVRIGHSGRKLGLRFACALTQAKVLNTILEARLPAVERGGSPRPKGVRYEGQGALDLEVHLAQPDPLASFEALVRQIRKAGGRPSVDPGVIHYLRRAHRRSRRQAAPLRHTVYLPDGAITDADEIEACARRTRPADRRSWVSPVIPEGSVMRFTRAPSGQYSFSVGGKSFTMSTEELAQDFTTANAAAGWVTVHAGLSAAYPDLFAATRARATALGIDRWIDWEFQLHDLVETVLKPRGAIVAWQMGLGKARLSAALVLLRGVRHGLVVTEAGLVPELTAELSSLPIDPGSWKVIESVSDTRTLKRINVISYERLRMPIAPGARRTYADRLRRRCGLLVSDEGSVLANPESDRSRALAKVSAPRRYTLTGTPAPNYPHDIVPILAFTCGDGTAAQRWGWRHGHLETSWRKSMSTAVRGKEAVRDNFCVFEWVTREFEQTLLDGAKRMIPSIRNVSAYREMLAGAVKRRLQAEPDVRRYVKIEPPQNTVREIAWDDQHLGLFLEVADEFASWYRQAFQGRRGDNLAVILKRIRAVSYAADFPQHGVEWFRSLHGWTSKQRWVLDRSEALAQSGEKVIVYAEHPELLEMMHAELGRRGVTSLPFHGGLTIRNRTRRLDDRFRNGDATVLLASLGVTQRGHNLPQASRGIMASRAWLATTEDQAIYRMCRPQQKRPVRVDFPHLPGSLDIYKAQAVAFKSDAAHAGLDWGAPTLSESEFQHLTTVIYRFVEDLASQHGIERSKVREHLAGRIVEARHA